MRPHLISYLVLCYLFVHITVASRILHPSDTNGEFDTPILHNGLIGGFADDFDLVANVSFQRDGCDKYEANGQFVMVYLPGSCQTIDKINIAIDSGAIGILFRTSEHIVGRLSRVPVTSNPSNFPVVLIGKVGTELVDSALKNSDFVTIQLTPGRNVWIEEIFSTGWFLTLQILFIAAWTALLIFVIVKFSKKVNYAGFQWNISFVYLLIQMIFCAVNVVSFVDPINSRGLFSYALRMFLGFFPNAWAFTALLLMAFFWFETVSQFTGLKSSPFLSKRVQIPFYVLAGLINLIPIIATVLSISVADSVAASAAIGVVLGVFLLVVAAFYITVGVKVLRVVKRSRDQNSQKRRIKQLKRIQISVIISCVVSTTHPLTVLILNGLSSFTSEYLLIVTLFETSLFLGFLTFIQVYFMHTKAANTSFATATAASAKRLSSVAGKKTTTSDGSNKIESDQ